MIGVIIQARIGSTRLPAKIFKKIGDKTLLEHIFYRLSFLKNQVKVVLATSVNQENDVVETFCRESNIDCFRGSENNVLERYFLCAEKYSFAHLVRLTADNPFVDIEELDNLIELHLKSLADYSTSQKNLPKGAGAEIFTFDSLKTSYLQGKEPHHIEHVNEYILDNPDLFKISTLDVPKAKQRPDINLSIDTIEDYERVCRIAEKFPREYVKISEIIEIY